MKCFVTGEWRRLRNEELYDRQSSPDIVWVIRSRIIRWEGHVARMGNRRSSYRVLVGRPEGKRPLAKPRCRWENNIKMDVQNVVWGGVDWIDLAYDRDTWRVRVFAELNHPVK
jgi:hypothetical protein